MQQTGAVRRNKSNFEKEKERKTLKNIDVTDGYRNNHQLDDQKAKIRENKGSKES